MAKKKITSADNDSGSPDISMLPEVIEEVRLAALDLDPGPQDPTSFSNLLGRLTASRDDLPPLYQQAFYDPYLTTLQSIGSDGFIQVLLNDPQRNGIAGLMLDIGQCILQNGEGFEERATDAFQEVVSDLFNGFLRTSLHSLI